MTKNIDFWFEEAIAYMDGKHKKSEQVMEIYVCYGNKPSDKYAIGYCEIKDNGVNRIQANNLKEWYKSRVYVINQRSIPRRCI